MTIDRRRLLRCGVIVTAAAAARLTLPACAAAPAAGWTRAVAASNQRRIALKYLHTGEEIDAAYVRDHASERAVLGRISRVLRDHRTGAEHAIDPTLIEHLHDLAATLGVDAAFMVICGYRSPPPGGAVRRLGLHEQGRAVDLRIAGVDSADVAARAAGLGRGGVGYYRSLDCVHLDTGATRCWRG